MVIQWLSISHIAGVKWTFWRTAKWIAFLLFKQCQDTLSWLQIKSSRKDSMLKMSFFSEFFWLILLNLPLFKISYYCSNHVYSWQSSLLWICILTLILSGQVRWKHKRRTGFEEEALIYWFVHNLCFPETSMQK